MIKKLIFDIDNTLIMWQDKYINAMKETVSEYNLNVDYLKLHNLVETYEEYYNIYSKENMINLFNKKLNLNLDMSFMNSWLDKLGHMVDIDENVIDTLKYLSQKYEIVVLTNFFTDVQIERLKNAGLYQYITKVYGGEIYIKPSIESFKMALGDTKTDEAIMIGDNIEVDIKGAMNAGIRPIFVDLKDNTDGCTFCTTIKQIKDLKEML
ncbi:MAG: HAD family hydrolase [Bacilli bacterium]|nr:HAD family hydrolase [Bacilli bacterium]